MNAKTEEESLIVEMSLDAIAELLDKKLAEQRAHLDAHIARLEGMLLMATRPVAQVQAAPAQPATAVQPTAPATQVPVYRDPFLVALYQPSAYPGWLCKYQDNLAHPVITLDQLAEVEKEGNLKEYGGKPAINR
jgi:hypothetical protein